MFGSTRRLTVPMHLRKAGAAVSPLPRYVGSVKCHQRDIVAGGRQRTAQVEDGPHRAAALESHSNVVMDNLHPMPILYQPSHTSPKSIVPGQWRPRWHE